MTSVRNIVLAAGTAGALALGSAALAQDPPHKPQSAEKHQGRHDGHGKQPMRDMRGGCHGQSQEKHDHS